LSGGPVCYGYKPLVLYRVDAFSDEFTGFFFALAGFGKAYFRIDTDGIGFSGAVNGVVQALVFRPGGKDEQI
jgi:hypothetical protein